MDNQEGTAVLDAPPAAVEELTTDLAPEADVLEAADQGDIETTETVDPESLPLEERPEFKEALEAQLKAAESKARESERQKQEREGAERNRQQNLAAAQFLQQQGVERMLADGLKPAIEEGKDIDLTALVQNAQNVVYSGVFGRIHSEYARSFVGYLNEKYPGFTVPPELIQRETDARTVMDYGGQAEAWFDILAAAARSKELPELTKQAEEAAAKRAKSEQVKRAAGDKTGPTAVGGVAPGGKNFRTQLEVDTAFSKGEITLPEVKRWLARGLPYA